MNINIQFKLKKPTSDGTAAISTIIYTHGERFTAGTGKKINPELWDNSRQRPYAIKRTNSKELKQLLNKHKLLNPNLALDLANIENRLENIVTYSKSYFNMIEEKMTHPTKVGFKEYVKTKISKPAKKTRLDFEDYLTKCIREMYSGDKLIVVGKKKGSAYSNGTVKNYNNLLFNIKEYRKTKGIKRPLVFDDFTMELYNKFLKYCIFERDLSVNYFGSLIKNLKSILGWGFEEGLHACMDYRKKGFAKLTEETDKISLTESELNMIYTLKLEVGSKLDRVRDVFLCGCYTAQRYGDYSRIQKANINFEDSQIVLSQRKESIKVHIPIALEPNLKPILEKYDYSLPETYINEVNKEIKEIARL